MVRKIKMLGDNEINFILTKNPKSQNQIKHIDVMHQHMHELMQDGELIIE